VQQPPIATGGAAVNAGVAELAAIPRWVCWKAVKRDSKTTKVPRTPAGRLAKSTDPRTWSTFNECYTAAFVDGRHDGIGFVFTADDDLAGVDLDGCIQDGSLEPWAAEIVSGMASYAEISPSGTGVKLFVRAKLPEFGRRNGRLEVYGAKRFFTVTGQHLAGAPEQINGAQAALDRLWAQHFSKPGARANGAANGSADTLPPYPDRAAIEALLRDPTAAAYWHQSFTVMPADDRSPSGWDLAFAGYLARKGLGRLEIAAMLRAYRAHHAPTKGKQDRADYIFATTDQAIDAPEDDDEDATFGQNDNDLRGAAPQASHRYCLEEVHAVFRRWLGPEYDIATLNAVLAAAAAEKLPGDPLWLLVISGPGNAKTETVQALRGAGAHVTSTIASEGALLSASAKRDRTKGATGGLLRKIGNSGLLVIKDVTSILSADRNTRGSVLAAMREVYDGRWERNVGTDGGRTLTWEGRIAVVGAVTTAWDTAHSVVATMGDRFVLIRADSHTGRCLAGRRAIRNTGQEKAMRDEMADAVCGLIDGVEPSGAVDPTDDEVERILAAADVATLVRTGVETDYRGDVIGAHMPEMPTRFAKQLTQILRGGVAIGMDRGAALALAIRCAVDSVPPLRLALLRDVEQHPHAPVIDIRRRLEQPRMTVDRQLQALHCMQLLVCAEIEDSSGFGRVVHRRYYTLAPDLDLSSLTCPKM
jgi:hypothetical protein